MPFAFLGESHTLSWSRLLGFAVAAMWPAVALAQTATITGDVSLLYRPNPLPGITVVLTDDYGTERGSQTTTGTGLFSFTGLPAGTYYLHTENDLGFTNEAHGDVLCPLRCTWPFFGSSIDLVPGAVFQASFVLDRGGVISGVVTDADSSAPLPGGTTTTTSFGATLAPSAFTACTRT